MKKLSILFLIISFVTIISSHAKEADNGTDISIKNSLFSISVPKDFKGIYNSKIKKDSISIYHTDSEKAGFGGFAFGIKAYKNPADYAVLPGGKKIGELKDRWGRLFDVVLKYPTDVQYDYTKSPTAPESYKRLYDLGEVINIQGVRGAVYYKNQGMKGENLYKDILNKHITAINEKWDSTKLEREH